LPSCKFRPSNCVPQHLTPVPLPLSENTPSCLALVTLTD
jgi:hypothetical protein